MTESVQRMPLAWTDDVLDLAEALEGHTPSAYVVGGAVRDAFLRAPIRDIDLVTQAGGRALARKIANLRGGAYYALDDVRDIGRAILRGRDGGRLVIDVSAFRGASLEEDLLDRDFSINAMAVALTGSLDEVHDPAGGWGDLRARRLRLCRPDSLTRDPVRVLRAVRYSVQFGLRVEPDTLQAARAAAPLLAGVSAERLRDELFKLLAQPRARTGLVVAQHMGALAVVLPDALASRREDQRQTERVVETLSQFATAISPTRTDETAAQFGLGMFVIALDRFRGRLQAHLTHPWPDERQGRALLLLAGLLRHLSDELVEEYAITLRLSVAERQRLAAISRTWRTAAQVDCEDPVAVFRFWRAAGEAGPEALLLHLAERLASYDLDLDQDDWLAALERVRALLFAWYEDRERQVSPPVLVTGDELMRALGIRPGRLVGELLAGIEEAQVRGEVTTVQDALRWAQDALGNRRPGADG